MPMVSAPEEVESTHAPCRYESAAYGLPGGENGAHRLPRSTLNGARWSLIRNADINRARQSVRERLGTESPRYFQANGRQAGISSAGFPLSQRILQYAFTVSEDGSTNADGASIAWVVRTFSQPEFCPFQGWPRSAFTAAMSPQQTSA